MKIIRFTQNPLVVPDQTISWMTENAFNPGVIREGGVFYMLIRGGTHRTHQRYSDIGVAISDNGTKWYVHEDPILRHKDFGPATENGIEDPRIVKWNGYYYIFATACHKHYGRIGIWRSHRLYGGWRFWSIPFDWEDKDACIIPEMIDGRVYMIHRMAPNMWISSTDQVGLRGEWKNHKLLLKADQVTLDGDVPFKIGLDGPPMKLGDDWFVMFHARFEPIEYRNSYMILDGDNPQRIKYIHPLSILRPELGCEKWGAVPHVCFSNGIVDMGDRWYIYWGAADTVVCGGYLLKEEVKI